MYTTLGLDVIQQAFVADDDLAVNIVTSISLDRTHKICVDDRNCLLDAYEQVFARKGYRRKRYEKWRRGIRPEILPPAPSIDFTQEVLSFPGLESTERILLETAASSLSREDGGHLFSGAGTLADQALKEKAIAHGVEISELAEARRIIQQGKMLKLDVVILTILPEEYQAVSDLIPNLQPPNDSTTNLYAWRIGSVRTAHSARPYRLAAGMIGRAGTTKSALATIEAIERWHPRYIFFVGIAGGLGGVKKGDVVISDVVHGYEYGKLEKSFHRRTNWTFNTDQGLLNGAVAFSLGNEWKALLNEQPPQPCIPQALSGEVASGDKVVDDPSNEFFSQVLQSIPKIKAVEMEGAGAGEAIDLAHAKGHRVGFMMVRGISDLPRPVERDSQEQGTQERDNWKPYASATAAAFTIGWISSGLPEPPSMR
jgi:nucleoside phosphorylase